MSEYKNLIVLSSPSGGGKSTLAKHLMKIYPKLEFSVSATTRKIREGEIDGKDYFFLTKEDFIDRIKKNDLIEYEEIFGNLYGTLRSEIKRAVENNKTMLFDVDVKGAESLKKAFPDDTLTVFIYPPNMDELEKRLRNRRTETDEEINRRLSRAEEEFTYKQNFKYQIENNDLEQALREIEALAKKYIDPKLKGK
jgi:guanylate kinase